MILPPRWELPDVAGFGCLWLNSSTLTNFVIENAKYCLAQGRAPIGRNAAKIKKSIGDFSDAPVLTLPRGQENYYGSTVNATQAPLVVTGALAAAPALKRMTPSSFEQKLRTPDWL